MKNIYLIFVMFIFALFSCNTTPSNKSSNDCPEDSINLVKYADNLDIYKYQSGYKLIINTNSDSKTFYLFNDTVKVPDDIIDEEIIRIPIKSSVAFSSTQWSVFLKLGDINRVKGILEGAYTYNTEIQNLIKLNNIADVGLEHSINTEKVIQIQPDVILYTPYPGQDYSYLKEFCDATMIPFSDYLESHPLGRAEWMKVVGLLCDKENETAKWYDEMVERYESLCDLCSDVDNRPTIFSDLPFENQWYIPGGKSYMAKIFADAGADYIWKDNDSKGSLHVDAELVLAKAQRADFWRVMNSYDTPFTYERLAEENELFPLFDAFKNKRLLVCNVRETRYFEQSQYEPDVILADFIFYFHPDLLKNNYDNYTPKYFKKLIK